MRIVGDSFEHLTVELEACPVADSDLVDRIDVHRNFWEAGLFDFKGASFFEFDRLQAAFAFFETIDV